MIRVTIEIVPFGDEETKRVISKLQISRTSLSGNPETYNVKILNEDGSEKSRGFQVRDHWYEDGAEELVRRALEVYCGKVGGNQV